MGAVAESSAVLPPSLVEVLEQIVCECRNQSLSVIGQSDLNATSDCVCSGTCMGSDCTGHCIGTCQGQGPSTAR
jgi:hypothetical protein